MKYEVLGEETVFEEFIAVKKGDIRRGSNEVYSRVRVERDDAAVMFIYNVEKNTIVLVEQFRYAVHKHNSKPILEIPAGKVDAGESPKDAAVRETLEECGYQLHKANLTKLGTFFVSPGYTSERFVLFYTEVKNGDKIEAGGGLKSENEFINVVEMSPEAFYNAISKGEICDAKTALAAQMVKNKFT